MGHKKYDQVLFGIDIVSIIEEEVEEAKERYKYMLDNMIEVKNE